MESYRLEVDSYPRREPAFPHEPELRRLDEPPGRRRWWLEWFDELRALASITSSDLRPGID